MSIFDANNHSTSSILGRAWVYDDEPDPRTITHVVKTVKLRQDLMKEVW